MEAIPAMIQCNITITNYVGQAREDILTMAKHLGANVSRNMSAQNTHLICANAVGEKYDRALQWNLHIVNHFWLEDIYVTWTFQREAKPKYSHFSISLGDMVNKSGIVRTNSNRSVLKEATILKTVEQPQPEAVHHLPDSSKVSLGSPAQHASSTTAITEKENSQNLANKRIEHLASLDARKRSHDDPVLQSISKKTRHSGVITVLFTGIRADPKYKGSLASLGFRITDNPESFDFLITNRVARTEKFLLAVAKGIPIVSDSWILKCLESGTIVDYHDYLLQDSEVDLKISLNRAVAKSLLHGYRIYFTPNILPEPNILKRLIVASGGTPEPMITGQNLESSIRKMKMNDKFLLVSSSKDSTFFPRLKKENIPVYTGDFFLNCILRQEVNPTVKDVYN
jgi:hypothetical protein